MAQAPARQLLEPLEELDEPDDEGELSVLDELEETSPVEDSLSPDDGEELAEQELEPPGELDDVDEIILDEIIIPDIDDEWTQSIGSIEAIEEGEIVPVAETGEPPDRGEPLSEFGQEDFSWLDVSETALERWEDDHTEKEEIPLVVDRSGIAGELESDEESEEPLTELQPVDTGIVASEEVLPAQLEPSSAAMISQDSEVEELVPVGTEDEEPRDVVEVESSLSSLFGEAYIPFSDSVMKNAERLRGGDRAQGITVVPIHASSIVIRGLNNDKYYHVAEYDAFLESAIDKTVVVPDENGILKIVAHAYHGRGRIPTASVAHLAEQVVNNPQRQGVDDLFGGEDDSFDFSDLLESAPAEPGFGEMGDGTLRAGSDGFLFPGVDGRGDSGVRQVYRQLVRITRRWQARVAIVLDQSKDGDAKGIFGLGLPDSCELPFTIPAQSDIAQVVLNLKRVLLLKKPLGYYQTLHASCYADKLSSIQSWVFFPLVRGDTQRYLVVGFSRSFDDLTDLAVQNEIVTAH